MDFLRGAALGEDGLGKPILALNSVTKRGESKIAPFLKQGKSVIYIYLFIHSVVKSICTTHQLYLNTGCNLNTQKFKLKLT